MLDRKLVVAADDASLEEGPHLVGTPGATRRCMERC
jgi:hypothetical protein